MARWRLSSANGTFLVWNAIEDLFFVVEECILIEFCMSSTRRHLKLERTPRRAKVQVEIRHYGAWDKHGRIPRQACKEAKQWGGTRNFEQ